MNELEKQWIEDKGAQYPYSEEREGDGQAGQDNGAWGKQVTTKEGHKEQK